jgi:prepilin-type N-terminal cleavage/methylation domain-containing protein
MHRPRAARGFTLIEMALVLGVIAAILAALAPAAFTYIRDAQITQAQNDANQIGRAIHTFMEHTALQPYKNGTTTATPKVSAKEAGVDFECLYGPGTMFTTTTDATTSDSWTSASPDVQCDSGTVRDTLENHLITNTPGGSGTKNYVTTGKLAWRGPYLPSVPPDPWGNAFLVNIGKGDPSASPKKAVFVISAGPDGILNTSSDAARNAVVTPSGDDIIARIQ